MAKITIIGDVAVVTSAKKLEDIRTLEKYMPKALSLFEPDDNGKSQEIFRVCSTEGAGDINQYGASFGSASRDGNGFATITLRLPAGLEDRDAVLNYVSDAIGAAVIHLNQIEEGMNLALSTVSAQKQQILTNIEMA